MAVDFAILAELNVVFVRCHGDVNVAQTLAAFERYVSSEDFRPGQSQLVDLTNVTSYERDFTQIMSLQALQAEAYFNPNGSTHLIYVAPNEKTQKMAMASLRSWRNVPGVVPLLVLDVEAALEVLSVDASKAESILGFANQTTGA